MKIPKPPHDSVPRWVWMRRLLWWFPPIFTLASAWGIMQAVTAFRPGPDTPLTPVWMAMTLGGAGAAAGFYEVMTVKIRAGRREPVARPQGGPFCRFLAWQMLVIVPLVTLCGYVAMRVIFSA